MRSCYTAIYSPAQNQVAGHGGCRRDQETAPIFGLICSARRSLTVVQAQQGLCKHEFVFPTPCPASPTASCDLLSLASWHKRMTKPAQPMPLSAQVSHHAAMRTQTQTGGTNRRCQMCQGCGHASGNSSSIQSQKHRPQTDKLIYIHVCYCLLLSSSYLLWRFRSRFQTKQTTFVPVSNCVRCHMAYRLEKPAKLLSAR